MTSVGRAAFAPPAVRRQAIEDAQIFDNAVTERDIELQEITVAAQAAVAREVPRVVRGEEILAGRKRRPRHGGELAGERVIERRRRLLDPGERIGRERLDVAQRRCAIEGAVAVDRERHTLLKHAQHGLDAPQVRVERGASDLDLETPVTLAGGAPHIVAETFDIAGRPIVPAAGIDRDRCRDRPLVVAPRQQAPQRLVLDLAGEIPQRGVDQPHRSAALAVAARLLVAHQDRPSLVRIDAAAIVGVVRRIGREQSRDEPLAQQAAMAVASDRIEGEARERLAVLACIGVHDEDARGHVLEADARVARGAAKPDRLLGDADDTHRAVRVSPASPDANRAGKRRRRFR